MMKNPLLNNMRLPAISVLLFLILVSSSWAQAPTGINYQGYLTTNDGTLIEGAVDLSFSLYRDQAKSDLAWTETHSNVQIEQGVFNVTLGANTPLSPSLFVDALYLAVAVDGEDEMDPLHPLLSVPYAFRALSVEGTTLGDLGCGVDQILRYDGSAWGCADSPSGTDFALSSQNCPAGQVVDSIDAGGTIDCVDNQGEGSSYLAGTGLVIDATTISVAPSGIGSTEIATGAVTASKIAAAAVGASQVASDLVQLRVGGDCPQGSAIRAIGESGAVTCDAGVDSPLELIDSQNGPIIAATNSGDGTAVIGTKMHKDGDVTGFLAGPVPDDTRIAGVYGFGRPGIFGRHTNSGNYGRIGGSNSGVKGVFHQEDVDEASSNFGALGTQSSGVFGKVGDNFGQLGTDLNGVFGYSTGDWAVAGQHKNGPEGQNGPEGGIANADMGVWGSFGSNGPSGSLGSADSGVYARHPNGSSVALATAEGGVLPFAGIFIGDVLIEGELEVNGPIYKEQNFFRIDHPLFPSEKYLQHSVIESSDIMNLYNGNVLLDENGEAEVALPDWFEALNKDYRYQLTCIGGYAPVYIAAEIEQGRFRIAGGRNGLKVSWQVTGIRRDPYALDHPLQIELDKPADKAGTYLYPAGYQ